MISFSEFILRYLDEWNMTVKALAEDLDIGTNTVVGWLYKGFIPAKDRNEFIEYFGDEFKEVVFDRKVFNRKFKVIRPDGSSQIYGSMLEMSRAEDVSYVTVMRRLSDGGIIKIGNHKGYRFKKVYVEVES